MSAHTRPLLIKMDPRDNVAIVAIHANEGGLEAGTSLSDGLMRELQDLPTATDAGVQARRWLDLMDVSAGRSAEVGCERLHLMLNVARSRKASWAEKWQLRNARVLIQPAPMT